MNFLSHFYLHQEPEDNYYTVGLTMPDLLGFHSRRIRLTKKYLINAFHNEKDMRLKSHISGIIMHFLVDNYFHGSKFFKDNLTLVQDFYVNYNRKGEKLSHFHGHILLELLIDRYLSLKTPDLPDRFYKSYQSFDFYHCSNLFLEFDNFNQNNFLSLAYNISISSFLKEYIYDEKIGVILNRVSRRIGIAGVGDDDLLENFNIYVRDVYNELIDAIKALISNIKLNKTLTREYCEKNNFFDDEQLVIDI